MTDIGNLKAVEASGDPDSLSGKVARSARILAENATDDAPLIGFVTVAIYGDGAHSIGYQCPTIETHPFCGPVLFTAYIKEVIERNLTGQQAADDYAREFLL